jgi:hypothetical protein
MILPLRIFGQTVDTLCQFVGIAQIILTPICGHLSCMQVFNWLLELIQARKSWIDHPIQQVKGASGLLFVTPEKTKSQVCVFRRHTLLLKDLIMDGSHFWCLVWEIPVRWYQDLLVLSNSAVVQCLFITVLYDWWILALKCICTGCGAVTRLNSLLFCWKLRGSSRNCA